MSSQDKIQRQVLPILDRVYLGVRPLVATDPTAKQRTMTAVIDAIDPKRPSISFKGPNGWSYSSRVAEKKTLAKVKVGDRIEMTWTTALMISLEEAPIENYRI